MTHPDFEGAKAWAIGRLEADLSAEYLYHSVAHTRDDVLPAAMRLARLSQLSGADGQLLAVAATYHDVGFIVSHQEHESHSIAIVQATLPQFGFQPEQIAKICGAIEATKLPQSPADLFQALLSDADLDVLGRDDYWPSNLLLRRELEIIGNRPIPEVEWYASQLAFLQAHHYFTAAARTLRSAGKLQSIAALRSKLDQMTGT
jgi:uncharacterized protein